LKEKSERSKKIAFPRGEIERPVSFDSTKNNFFNQEFLYVEKKITSVQNVLNLWSKGFNKIRYQKLFRFLLNPSASSGQAQKKAWQRKVARCRIIA